MGKKSKRNNKSSKKGNENSRRETPKAESNSSPPLLASQNHSMISIYKYSTDKVLEWGRLSYAKLHGSKKKSNEKWNTLVSLFSSCFQALIEAKTEMPEPVMKALRTAINYRKRVGGLYMLVNASKENRRRHEWIILQLEKVERSFVQIQKEHDRSTVSHAESNANGETRNAFEALSVDHEGSELMDEDTSAEQYVRPQPAANQMTPEEIMAEQRCFNVSLLLLEISEARDDLRHLWKTWSSKHLTITNDAEAAGELLAATACTEYTLQALRKLILQACIENEGYDDFELLLEAFGDSNAQDSDDTADFGVGDCVVLTKLANRSDLNGREGIICTQNECNRFGVKLFCEVNIGEQSKKRPIVSVKAENLLPADNTFQRLSLVYKSLKEFQFDTVPMPPRNVYGTPISSEVMAASLRIIADEDLLQSVVADKDYKRFLLLALQYFVPLWISMAKYLPPGGAADVTMIAYMRDFNCKCKAQFHHAFAVMVAIDCAFATAAVGPEVVVEMAQRILDEAFDMKIYEGAIRVFDEHGSKSEPWYCHLEIYRQLMSGRAMTVMFPWMCGEILLHGFRLNLVLGCGMPYLFVKEYATILHLYWMLRCEGYLKRIPEIEQTLIRMYRQHVYFRGGVPQKGRNVYLKSWQLAVGATANGTKLLDGRNSSSRMPLISKKGIDKAGLYVTEISRLLDVLQWKSMPIGNRATCFEEIQAIARDDCQNIFLAPLMSACLKLSRLQNVLGSRFVSSAREFGFRWIQNYATVERANQMTELSVVTFWGLSLADDRTFEEEKREGLSKLASCFRDFFREDLSSQDTDDKIVLQFNPSTHTVDPSLFGEHGARRRDQAIV